VNRWASRVVVLAVVLAVVVISGCVKNPGLPATGTSGYRAKASLTAEGVISGLATIRLGLDTEARHHTTGPYLAGVVSDQEDGVSGVISSFDAVAPPTAAARALRVRISPILSDAQDHISSARVALGADQAAAALRLRSKLSVDAARLEKFVTR
jgi:hypothetical protein